MKKIVSIFFVIIILVLCIAQDKNCYAKKKNYVTKTVPSCSNDFKAYEPHRLITYGAAGNLQKKAYTGKYGIRMYKGRYCIALGSYYSHKIGQKVDLVLSTGRIIKCVVADGKADRDTHMNHRLQRANNSVVEFVVDSSAIPRIVSLMGTYSSIKKFKGKVVKIKVYK